MTKALIALPVLFLIQGGGCDATKRDSPKPTQSSQGDTTQRPIRRFELTSVGFDIAFDTQTGQLCRTWDWNLKGPNTVAPESKVTAVAPLCSKLYSQYSVADTGVAASGGEQPQQATTTSEHHGTVGQPCITLDDIKAEIARRNAAKEKR
jgi:hypothetical protein